MVCYQCLHLRHPRCLYYQVVERGQGNNHLFASRLSLLSITVRNTYLKTRWLKLKLYVLYDDYCSQGLTLTVDRSHHQLSLCRSPTHQLNSVRGQGQERLDIRSNCQRNRQGRGVARCCFLRTGSSVSFVLRVFS